MGSAWTPKIIWQRHVKQKSFLSWLYLAYEKFITIDDSNDNNKKIKETGAEHSIMYQSTYIGITSIRGDLNTSKWIQCTLNNVEIMFWGS